MIKRKGIVFILVFCVLFAISTFAHPGRTDSNGGHWDRKNGTYHFHTGEYAGKGSSGSSSSSEYVPFTPPYEPPTENPYRTDNADTNAEKWYEIVLPLLVIVCLIVWWVWASIRSSVVVDDAYTGCGCLLFFALICLSVKLLENYTCVTLLAIIIIIILCLAYYGLRKLYKKIDGSIDAYERIVNEYISCKSKQEEKEAEYLTFEQMPIPDDCEIGFDGLPKEICVLIGWGDKFTVYQSRVGNKIHTVRGCCSAFEQKHIYNFINFRDLESLLCKKCSKDYAIPNLDWYKNHLQYLKLTQTIFELDDKKKELKEKLIKCRKDCCTFSVKFMLLFDKKNKIRLKNIDKTIKQLL